VLGAIGQTQEQTLYERTRRYKSSRYTTLQALAVLLEHSLEGRTSFVLWFVVCSQELLTRRSKPEAH